MIVDGNIDAINPDELSNGVMHWHKNKKMDDLMNFLAQYVHPGGGIFGYHNTK